MSADSKLCPRCAAPLPNDAPKGLCPRCLAAMSFATETVLTGADAVASQTPLAPDELAPHFPQLEILECLGRGGMGVVYKARQKSLNRIVALKLLAPERVADAKFAERFTHEAQALAALNHPSIVTIYDFGQAGGFYFLLMEFVGGVNLRQAMKAGRFTPEQALAIVPPVCEALQYAHEHGIVHRDIKPENLLLDKTGRVKIADFGIAKMLHADGSEVGLAESQPAGTPQYMAPEQKEHQRTDHRADIYSLGVVLYEMLTGDLPADKLQPPSRKVKIDVRLDGIVLRALEKEPELRYQTAGELRTQVETVVSTPRNSEGDETQASAPPRFLKVCTSTLTTPGEIGTWRGQMLLGRTRGQLILDDRQLTHSRYGINTVIPLAAIRDLSIGQYPRSVNPAGLDLISVTYEEAGQRKRVLLSPMESWFGLPSTWNARIAEWFAAIREAIIAATGRAPATTPASELGVPRGWIGLPFLLASAPVLIGMLAFAFLIKGRHGSNSSSDGLFLVVFFTGVFSFLILRRLIAGWNQPSTRGSLSRRLLGLTLVLAGVAMGWIQLSDGKRAHEMSLATMSSQIPTLQSRWNAAKQEEFVTRTTLREFESKTANPRTDAERRDFEEGRQRLTNALAQVVERGHALNKAVMDYTEKINQLQFPDSGTLKRALVLAAPLLLIGLTLLFWRSGPVEPGRSFIARYAGWPILLLSVLVLGFVFLRFFAESRSPTGVTSFDILPVDVSNNLNLGVSNNVVIVDTVAQIGRGNVEIHAVLEGPRLPAATEAALPQPSASPLTEAFVKPMLHGGNHPWRILSAGRHTWRLGFVLPDEALAEAERASFRPIGALPARPGRTVAGTLFEVRQTNGDVYVASLRVSPPLTPANPNWISVTGRSESDEAAVTLTWEVLASRPGMAAFSRAGSPIKVLQADAQTKLYGVSAQIELSEAGPDRVLFVRRIDGSAVREELLGNFRELADELIRTASFSAKTERTASIELCQFQGKPFTVRIDGGLPYDRDGGNSFPLIVISVVVLLVAASGIALPVALLRKGRSGGHWRIASE